MKLVTFIKSGAEQVGVVIPGEKIVPVKALGLGFTSMNDLICSAAPEDMKLMSKACQCGETVDLSDVQIISPIPRPLQDVLCLGLNYTEHAKEAGAYSDNFTGGKEKAIYFSKRVNEAVPHGGKVSCYQELTSKVDYEAELAVILGKDAYNVRPEDVRNYVFGYTVLNDMTSRDLQTGHKQWYFGKSLDGFCPIGPCIVTADEFDYPPRLRIGSTVNGQLRQDGNTGDMIHDIDEIVSELSRGMTLKAGTIIATGTPKGVAMGMGEDHFLKPGDIINCFIEGIGDLTITMY
ncbi:MAG: fumarylacetoacetate hydrolase family protein [Firmicutes bacterium]|nr:fumarylacetoacetate hydrolase family protein [Bacillota bacterium]